MVKPPPFPNYHREDLNISKQTRTGKSGAVGGVINMATRVGG